MSYARINYLKQNYDNVSKNKLEVYTNEYRQRTNKEYYSKSRQEVLLSVIEYLKLKVKIKDYDLNRCWGLVNASLYTVNYKLQRIINNVPKETGILSLLGYFIKRTLKNYRIQNLYINPVFQAYNVKAKYLDIVNKWFCNVGHNFGHNCDKRISIYNPRHPLFRKENSILCEEPFIDSGFDEDTSILGYNYNYDTLEARRFAKFRQDYNISNILCNKDSFDNVKLE